VLHEFLNFLNSLTLPGAIAFAGTLIALALAIQ
jgi:hypothetical protein